MTSGSASSDGRVQDALKNLADSGVRCRLNHVKQLVAFDGHIEVWAEGFSLTNAFSPFTTVRQFLTEWSVIGRISERAMARPKEFESETALKKAIGAFSEHGYEGTSTDALLQAMGISRQSMYDSFGDKRRLYLEALQRYTADSISNQLRALNSVSSPVKGLEAMLNLAVSLAIADPKPKCLGISAVCEFGRSDPEVTMITDMAGKTMLSSLERRVSEAKAAGEISRSVDAQTAAQFIMATLAGIKIAARSGATPESLRGIARMAMRSLK